MSTDRNQSPAEDVVSGDAAAHRPAKAPPASVAAGEGRVSGMFAGSVGVLVAGLFYAGVWATGSPVLERYFLGHPVAVVATSLFWLAVAILTQKHWKTAGQWARFRTIRDADLLPLDNDDSPAGRWQSRHDAGYVARSWLESLHQLPPVTRSSLFVRRLSELLTRQTHRGTTKHLADDLRELSARDADVAHDSLGLVRIIVWAIPMLGFLGTVIGITQTLGGLDFSDGTAAVDRLKSGLYVAFDTTALGLVLSVVAIFLQFPIERSEQRLLAAIDARVGELTSSCLPSDEAADDQTALIADLCEGIQAAVAQSLASQAELWRQTIDEANQHWQQVRQAGADELVQALSETLTPTLDQHAAAFQQQTSSLGASLERVTQDLELQTRSLADSLDASLRDHARSLDESARFTGDRLESQAAQWHEVLDDCAESLLSHHHELAAQCANLTETNRRAESLQSAQAVLDANLERLQLTNEAIAQSVKSAGGDGMAEAMRILARAVDVLTQRLPERSQAAVEATRRAA